MKFTIKPTVLLLLAGLLCAIRPALADGKDADLESVLAAVAIIPPQTVRFREERHNPMLKEPMVLTGTLEYLGKGILRKRIESPFEEAYLVEPEQVSIERESGTEVIRGRRARFVAGFLGGIESVLAGDIKALEDSFLISLEGTGEAWTLDLTPRSRQLAKHMQGLVISGNESSVMSIRVQLDEEFHLIEMFHEDPSRSNAPFEELIETGDKEDAGEE